MNIAEHVGSTRAVESHRFLHSRPVGAEIKSHTVRKREGIMKTGIAIPEFDDAPDRDHQQARFKHLVLLLHAVGRRSPIQAYRSESVHRHKPHYYLAVVT